MWVIIDTATGLTFPQRRTGRGGTWSEFDGGPPRLFKEKRHADAALRWWRDGPLHGDYEGDVYQTDRGRAVAKERQLITTIEVVEVEVRRV